MNLEKLIAVSGLPGLYRVIGNRNNGLIIEELESGKRRFASSRQYQYTPLESIAVYTDDGESTELKNVFRSMRDQLAERPVVEVSAPADELHTYFANILPNYDRDRVHTGDIKKIIKWFGFLHAGNLLAESPAEAGEEEE